jgi:hypothetical protein
MSHVVIITGANTPPVVGRASVTRELGSPAALPDLSSVFGPFTFFPIFPSPSFILTLLALAAEFI